MEGKCVVRTWKLSIILNSEVFATELERFESIDIGALAFVRCVEVSATERVC